MTTTVQAQVITNRHSLQQRDIRGIYGVTGAVRFLGASGTSGIEALSFSVDARFSLGQWPLSRVVIDYGIAPPDTINIDPGSVALTGNSVTLTELFSVTQGTVAFTGRTVLAVDTISILKGSVTINGQSVLASDTVAVSKADLTLTGKTVSIADILSITNGSIVLSGQTVTIVDSGGGDIIPVDSGSVSFAGGTITVTTGFTPPPNPPTPTSPSPSTRQPIPGLDWQYYDRIREPGPIGWR